MRQTEGRGIWRSCLALLLALALCLGVFPVQAWAVEEEPEDGAEVVTEDVTEEAEAEPETVDVEAEDEAAEPEEAEVEAEVTEEAADAEVPEDGEPEAEEAEAAEVLPEEEAEEAVTEEAALGLVDQGECGDHLSWTLDDGGVLIIRGSGPMANYESWGAPWYSKRESITSIVIQQGATSIGDYAFQGCNSLTSVSIPNSVTSIGELSFGFCLTLPSIDIPDSVNSIGKSAFIDCQKLTSVSIPNSVTSIGDYAFMDCYILPSVEIPESVTSLGRYLFFKHSDAFMIKGKPDSLAQQYAEEYEIPFLTLKMPIGDVDTTGIAAKTYTGKALTPAPKLTRPTRTLQKGTDYTLSYENNTNAGTATVTITGKGNYTGTRTVNFTIKKAAQTVTATKASATVEMGKSVTITGKGQGKITYTSANKKIATVTSKGVIKGVAPGTVKITIKAAGNGNYNAGTKVVTIKVVCPKPSITKLTNSKSKTMTVTWGKKAGVTGYQIQYSLNKNFSGAKTVTVKGAKVTSKAISKLTKNKTYYVRIRTYYKTTKTVSAWSTVKTVKLSK